MGLLSDMFQQQQNIANNPTQAIRTPQQIAYDNLLNRQANIEQQNKNYQTFNGIMSGVGGLGKIIASSMVKDPMQQAGAMVGIGEQEQRLDNLRQAYENVRNAQNKDYVTQAQQQLALARDDEDKAYNRAYQEAKDKLAQQNADRNYGLEVDKFGFIQKKDDRDFKNTVRQQEIANKWKEIDDINKKEAIELDKINNELRNGISLREIALKEKEAANRPLIEEQKAAQEQLKKNQERAFNLINSNSVTPALGNLMLNNPELMKYLKDSGEYSKAGNLLGILPWKVGGNDNKFDFNYEQYLIDNGIPVTKKNIKELKKQLGL